MRLSIGNETLRRTEPGFFSMLGKDLKKNKNKYLMVLPVVIFYLLFYYKPMYGVIIAFQNYSPIKGITGSQWVGFKHFIDFTHSLYFWRVFRNTLAISVYDLIVGFPAPIILVLLLNEIKNSAFKNTVQTISYLPHFISLVVICGIIKDFCLTEGIVNDLITFFGGERTSILQRPELFRSIFVSTNIWQQIGWSSIIYLAALSSIDTQMYEAAILDGAGRFKQMWYVTIPGLMPTIVIMFILRVGKMLEVGFEKIILLYNPATYETADVISSFVFRKGLQELSWSYSTAIGLFDAVINLILLLSANWMSKKLTENSLW